MNPSDAKRTRRISAFVSAVVACAASPTAYAMVSDDHGRAEAPPVVRMDQEQAGAKPVAPAIDPQAKAIYDKGAAKARALKGIALLTQMKLEDADGSVSDAGAAAMLPPGFDSRYRVRLAFAEKPDFETLNFGRMRIERITDAAQAADAGVAEGAVAEVFTFDGASALLVQPGKKTYSSSAVVSELAQSIFMAIPQWFLEQRVEGSIGDAGMPTLVAAALAGTATMDDIECDVVKIVRELDLSAMGGMPEGLSQKMSLEETISFAKSDGLPRKIVVIPRMPGIPDDAGLVPTAYFTAVELDPTFDATTFAVQPPDGFTKVEPAALADAMGGAIVLGGEDAGDGEIIVQPPVAESAVKVGDRAPDFVLTDFAGNEVTMASLKGKVVLLDFWATWCGPCKAAMPTIQKLADAYEGKDVVVLGINAMENNVEAAKDYVKSKKYTYGNLAKGDALAQAYGVRGIPTLVIIGKDGKIIEIEVGLADPTGATLQKAIDAALLAD